MKAGIRTTELWITVATDIGLLTAAIQGSLPPKWAAIAAAVSTAAYGLARGLAKQGTTVTAVDAVPSDRSQQLAAQPAAAPPPAIPPT